MIKSVKKVALGCQAAVIAFFTTTLPFGAQAQQAEPLLQKANLVYVGAFRLPQTNWGTNYSTFNYGGTAITYDPADNSLFIVGHPYGQLVAEVTIPTPVISSNLANLNTASIIQTFADPTEGARNAVNPKTPNPNRIGGLLVYGGKLIVSVYSSYDGSGTQTSSHFVRPLKLSTVGQVQGPYRVGTEYPGFVSGYMTMVPPEWQLALGGTALTGNCCIAITSIQSSGPAISAFDPGQLGAQSPTPATQLIGYPYSHPLGAYNSNNGLFNGTTLIRGVVFPVGTRSVLFFGRQGVGPFCYGNGTPNQAMAGTVSASGVPYCYDPAAPLDHGTHGYPYQYQVWAYDANDLLAVKNGKKQPYDLRPYATWSFELPFAGTTSEHVINGAAYDAKNNLIYISQPNTDNWNPIIHVFKITAVPPVPSPPSSLTVN